ncbi:UPF0481 protein At3g47200-like [Cornus florida]|uniref:UPF0481 protein At3g47200-like n=1 Tax=Cornus florida TaxID=4283 RepID=UPI00289BAF30|nr:UPF0481 protein At3g47200-like [Cornus florida]XP_059644878.1 UPF0481 protein At3g47200-like [Cornus florida]
MSEFEETGAKGIAEAKGTRVMDYNEVDPDLTDHKFDSSRNLSKSSSVSSEIKETAECIQIRIRELRPPLPEPAACIFKVHQGLRSVNEKAYTPTLVSIGPYHHENPNFSAMKEHKLRYLRSYLQRINDNIDIGTINVEPYLLRMEKLADKAQVCYADPICLDRKKFVEMLLLDACFVIEFLCKSHLQEDDPILRSTWMKLQIGRDLMLLENQIPLFVLSELFDLIRARYRPVTLIKMAALFPVSMMLPKQYSETKTKELIEKTSAAGESKHFLDLVHRLYLPSSRKDKYCVGMSCVTELQEAGISFEVNESDDVGIFDIRFENGRMKIPKFKVNDVTETFLRNIVAYEQHSSLDDHKYFTDYISIMDFLIHTGNDANALRLCGIIENMLGDDKEVALMFNKLGDGVVIPPNFYYSNVCKNVNHHCEKPWNEAMAKLRRNYFNNPWAGISTVAAVVLLLLTLIQTAATLIPLF